MREDERGGEMMREDERGWTSLSNRRQDIQVSLDLRIMT
jgi:hypothetical protein